jgi:hypothetical protein
MGIIPIALIAVGAVVGLSGVYSFHRKDYSDSPNALEYPFFIAVILCIGMPLYGFFLARWMRHRKETFASLQRHVKRHGHAITWQTNVWKTFGQCRNCKTDVNLEITIDFDTLKTIYYDVFYWFGVDKESEKNAPRHRVDAFLKKPVDNENVCKKVVAFL